MDNFTNGAETTLNGAINNSTTSITVTSATGFPATSPFNIRIKADGTNANEIMRVTAGAGTTTWTVTRASEAYAGTQTAVAHISGAVVEHVLTAAGLFNIGGFVLLEQHTASNSATLDFTTCISTTYDEYLIEFTDVLPATNGAALGCRISTNGGSSWDTASNYYNNNLYATTATWVAATAAATYVQIAHDVSNSGILGVCGSVRFWPSGSSQRFFVGQVSYLPAAANRAVNLVNSDYETGAFNAVRFLFTSGNITSGTIRIYGISK